jgi:hypothetical protein
MTANLAARVAAERAAAQGLPEHIEDDRVLDLVAGMLAEVRPEHDDGPGSWKPGRRGRPAAANEWGPPHATP